MRIVFSTDETTEVTDHIADHLSDLGHQVEVVRPGDPWPEVGRAVGETVAAGGADLGVVCCWTGTGVALAANKVVGVRAALCTDAATAAGARRWNDANVLALGLRLTSAPLADEIVDAFVSTEVDPDEVEAIARVEPSDGADPS
ncbi:MAG: RpiB/LacA/LacB family sugar-phosphate isomerase [Actinomycetota bacterium]